MAKTDSEWKQEIRTCLTSGGGNFNWGCLNKEGYLFKIATLNRAKVPSAVIEELIDTGKLVLKSSGTHYTYVTVKKRRALNI